MTAARGFLHLKFPVRMAVNGLALQGRAGLSGGVQSYRLQYSADGGQTYQHYNDGTAVGNTYIGSGDDADTSGTAGTAVANTDLNCPSEAKCRDAFLTHSPFHTRH